jgi:hypothetical protein
MKRGSDFQLAATANSKRVVLDSEILESGAIHQSAISYNSYHLGFMHNMRKLITFASTSENKYMRLYPNPKLGIAPFALEIGIEADRGTKLN